jgi:isopentenyl diphosphate isomerase/L-lactate dehydrogenase-like FMN-dependent dehydrogenase
MPKVLFDFIDGGAEDEITLRENHAAYSRITLRPRQAMSIPSPDISVNVLGADLSMPLALAPCGGSRLVWPDGERTLVRAAGAAGTAATLSTASGTSVEEEAGAATGPVWFQLYYPGDRSAAAELVGRAAASGFGALFITVDMPIRGNQERVHSAERVVPPRPSLRSAIRYGPQLISRPRWTWRYVADGMTNGVNPKSDPTRRATIPQAGRSTRQTVTWSDVEWLRSIWQGPFVVKGVLTGEDAIRAVECGADALVVSNHGGRQLDTGPATIRALPEVRAAVGDGVEILIDGGIRRGSDALKAIAYGANAALIGRPYLYGMAIAGETGVKRVLELFRDDFVRTLKLLGRASIAEIDRSCVEAPDPSLTTSPLKLVESN